jgi:hypothetical protein
MTGLTKEYHKLTFTIDNTTPFLSKRVQKSQGYENGINLLSFFTSYTQYLIFPQAKLICQRRKKAGSAPNPRLIQAHPQTSLSEDDDTPPHPINHRPEDSRASRPRTESEHRTHRVGSAEVSGFHQLGEGSGVMDVICLPVNPG